MGLAKYDMPRRTPLLNEIILVLLEEGIPMTAKQIAKFINERCALPYTVKEHNIINCIKNGKQANDYVSVDTQHKPYIFEPK